MPRYVVLEHVMPVGHERPTHWDVMLEVGKSLATWALEAPPADGIETSAERLADHRLAYLDFEGQVSGDRGTVSQFDTGEYHAIKMEPEWWEVRLEGRSMRGQLILVQSASGSPAWSARFTAES